MLYFDEDSDARFYGIEAGTMTAQDLDEILASLAILRPDVYVVGVNAQYATFRNKIIESYLDDFKIELGIEQEALRGNQNPWSYRRRANMAVLENAGIDSSEYLMEGARKRQISPWISIRMNDMHDGHDENSPIHTRHWREHPELRIPGNIPCENGFDYTLTANRKMYADFIAEAENRYHPDNILLDWLRWPAYFPRGTGRERARLITEMLEELKERLGHSFACRVPLTPETALKLGLDVKAWVEKGILSHLFLGDFGAGEHDTPVEKWRCLVGGLPIVVSLGSSTDPGPNIHEGVFTPTEMRARAAAAYWRGADGVYPFNCMKFLRKKYASPEILDFFSSLKHPEEVYKGARRHFPGWQGLDLWLGDLDQIFRIPGYYQEWLATHSPPANSMPMRGPADILIHTAKAPKQDAFLHTDATGVSVNGHPLTGAPPYRIPADYLIDGITVIHSQSDVNRLFLDFNISEFRDTAD